MTVASELVQILNPDFWLLNTALAKPTKEVLQALRCLYDATVSVHLDPSLKGASAPLRHPLYFRIALAPDIMLNSKYIERSELCRRIIHGDGVRLFSRAVRVSRILVGQPTKGIRRRVTIKIGDEVFRKQSTQNEQRIFSPPAPHPPPSLACEAA